MSLSHIRAVLIDVDNTLLDFDQCTRAVIRDAFAEEGLSCPEEVILTFRQINEALWRQIERGELTREQLHAVRWDRIFHALGIPRDGSAFEARFARGLAESHEPVDGATELLQYLSGRYIVCIASNSTREQQMHRLALAGMLPYIQHFFVSEDIGASKPDARFFRRCLEQLGDLSPDEVFLIGDSLTADIQGGTACGISTCWYNHRHQKLPTGFSPDFIVDSLRDIPHIL